MISWVLNLCGGHGMIQTQTFTIGIIGYLGRVTTSMLHLPVDSHLHSMESENY